MPTVLMKNDRRFGVVLFVLALAYPALVYFGLKWYSPKAVALTVGTVILIRLLLGCHREGSRRLALLLLPPLGLCAMTVVAKNREFILYLPVLTSMALLFSFGFTLWRPPSVVESFARLSVPNLTAEEADHCRRTTLVWAVFFLINGVIAFWTAQWGSLEAWGLYNGLLSYLAMGVLFTVEFIYRHWRFRRYIGLPTDPLFRRMFPPKG
jgi:uncharacterized membrane protein